MARSRAAGSPSKIVRVLAERDEALWKLRLTERELETQRRRIAAVASAKRPRFLPHVAAARETTRAGTIGEVRMLQADFGFRSGWNPEGRLLNPQLAAMALMGWSVVRSRLAAWPSR